MSKTKRQPFDKCNNYKKKTQINKYNNITCVLFLKKEKENSFDFINN